MRLFDRYTSVAAQIKQAAEAEDEKEAFRKTTLQYNHVRAAKNDKERTENEARIIDLEQQEQELAENSSQGLLDLDSITAQKVADLTEQLRHRNRSFLVYTCLKAVKKGQVLSCFGVKLQITPLLFYGDTK